jgi:hypothetical protein
VEGHLADWRRLLLDRSATSPASPCRPQAPWRRLLADNCLERPDGLIIGSIFTVLLMLACGVSRSMRSMEIRIPYGFFLNVESWSLGPDVRGKKVHLVPIKTSSAVPLSACQPARQSQRVLSAA